MSDIVLAKADELRTLALAAEQDMETARHALDAASARRDRLMAAADVLDPCQRFKVDPELERLIREEEAIEQREQRKRALTFAPAPVDEDPVADEVPIEAPKASTPAVLTNVCIGSDEPTPLFPPGKPRPPFTPAVGDSVLVCEQCGMPFPRNVGLLSVHTHNAHGRGPLQIEKLPRIWTAEDAEVGA